ncbi:MAG: WecB/TagA/CpsF family glycosyltransferase [Chloroflexota bacterium]
MAVLVPGATLAEPEPFLRARSSIHLLGIRIDRLHLDELLRDVTIAVRTAHRITVLYVNVHCMNVAYRDAEYAAILDSADVVYCDGTGVQLGARLAGKHVPARMTGADWIHDLCRMAIRENISLFLLGGEEGVARSAAITLKCAHPKLQITGARNGFGAGEHALQEIRESGADILLAGMGTPTQEKWIAKYRDEIDVPVVWAVGALFDFVSGRISRGPRWMTGNGLEWVCRLVAEPRKLWRRYLIGNPLFLWRVMRGDGLRGEE